MRTLIKYGVDTIKLNLSGEEITGMAAEETPMSDEEVAMAVREAKLRNKSLSAHARSSGSIKQCVRHGIPTSITPLSPTKKRSTCWKRPRKDISLRRGSPGS